MFQEVEKIIVKQVYQRFGKEFNLLNEIISIFNDTLKSIKVEVDNRWKYVITLLAMQNLKCFISAFDRLSKGYWSDSEALIKKAIENFLAQAFFYKKQVEANKYLEGAKLQKLIGRRDRLAKKLDEINKSMKFFPIEMEDFFYTYIYVVGYREANKLAHMDFNMLHGEIAAANERSMLASELIIGPKYESEAFKTSFNRLLIFSLFNVGYIAHVNGITLPKRFDEIVEEAFNSMGK